MFNTIIGAVATIVVVTLILVALLLVIKAKLTPSGSVSIDINGGKKNLEVPLGGDLMHTLADQGIFLPSACGGKANCGQCKVQVLEGGGSILPTEKGFFNRKQIKDGYRLGCQVKIKDNIKIQVPDSTLSVKKLECEVISNDNVATFIKEFTVKLPEGENIEFKSGEYIQIDIPAYDIDFADIDVAPEYRADWEKYGFFGIKAKNTVPTIRAYSMASYPAEKNVIKLNVRIATPPFDRSQPKGVFKMLPVPPGVASSYVFTRKPGDKVMISGPFGGRYGPSAQPHHAPLQDPEDRQEGKLLLRSPRPRRGLLPGGLRGDREGVPELQVLPRPRPSGSRSRCSRREVHPWLRPQCDVRDLPQGSRDPGRHQVLHVRPAYDGGIRQQAA